MEVYSHMSVVILQFLVLSYTVSCFVTISDFSVTSLPNLNSVGRVSCAVQGTNNTNTSLVVTAGDRTNVTLVDTAFEPSNLTLTKIFEVVPTQRVSQFHCTVQLPDVKLTKRLRLHALVQPALTRPPSAADIRSSSALITWDEWDNTTTGLGDGPISQYIIRYRERGNPLTYRRNVRTANTFKLTNLRPRTTYELFVYCQRPGRNGIGQSSPTLIFSTICPELTVERLAADTINLYPLHILFTWAPSSSVFCDVTYYEIAYSLLQQDGCLTIPSSEQEMKVLGNTTGVQFKIKQLHLFSTYKFFVRAFTETGAGNYSEMTFDTPEGEPPHPSNLTLHRSSGDFLRFSWAPIPCGSRTAVIRRYQGELYTQDNVLIHRGRILNDKMFSKIVGLEPCTIYWFRVAAIGQERFGEYGPLVEGTTLDGVPPIVSNITGKAGPSSTLEITWNAPANFNCAIIRYSLQLSMLISDHCTNETGRLTTYFAENISDTSATIPNLQPYSVYEVTVAAMTISGWGAPLTSTVITPRTAPLAAPSLNTPPQVTHDSVTFSWRPLQCGFRGGELIEYYYRLKSGNAKEIVTGTLPIGSSEVTLTNLESCKTYLFQIRARNEEGWGPFSDTKEVSTNARVPSMVRDISVEYDLSDSTEVVVRWNSPGYTPCPVSGYSVQISLANKDMCSERHTDVGRVIYTTAQLTYHFRDLYANSIYEVGISAMTEAGGGETRTLTLHTKGSPPGKPPINCGLVSMSPTDLVFTWEAPPCGFRNGVNIHYVYQLQDKYGLIIQQGQVTDPPGIVQDLKPFEKYLFRVRAQTNDGPGPFTEALAVITDPTTPDEPSELIAMNRTNSSIGLSWKTPVNPNGIISRYTIIYGPLRNESIRKMFVMQVPSLDYDVNKGDDESDTETDDDVNSEFDDDDLNEPITEEGNVYATVMDNLQAATLYVFTVMAHTSEGPGRGARINEYTRVTTPVAPPAPIIVTTRDSDVPLRIGFDQEMHYQNIDAFQVIVTSRKEVTVRSVPEYKSFAESPDHYVAAEWPSDELPDSFVVGDKKTYGPYYNAPLRDNRAYDVTLCSVVRSTNDVASSCSVPVSIPVAEDLKASSSSFHPAIIFIVGVCLLVIVALIVAVLVIKRRRSWNSTLSETSAKDSSQSLDSAIDVTAPPPEPMKRHGGAIRLKPKVAPRRFVKKSAGKLAAKVKINQLPFHVRELREDGDRKLKRNFVTLPADHLYPSDVAARAENRRKNRYLNTHPYDHARVILQELPDVPFSDYVNASYIDGFQREREYIATQGPSNSTLGDFWRMIWQEDVHIIVMLTSLRESDKKKCEQYWPAKNHFYGSISVFLIEEQSYTEFTERTLLLKKDGETETRQISHFHFTSWPDMTLPESPTMLLEFRNHVRSHVAFDESPIVVHCSAGVGRTGTFITIDAMIEMAQQEKAVNVWDFIWNMRTRRTRMVQTMEQYLFIYECLLEELNCGRVDRSTISIDRELINLRCKNPVTSRTYLEEQLLVLDALAVDPSLDDISAATSEANAEKNRFEDILPLDRLRPYLMTESDGGRNNYINAIFAPGYKIQNMFLLTQTPMEHTIGDFWRMVYDYKASIIVSLDDATDMDWSVSQYWPLQDDLHVFPFEIKTTDSLAMGDIYRREFALRNGTVKGDETARAVTQFEMQDWSIETSLPDHATLLSLIDMVENAHRENNPAPIVIHCRTGVYRCGLFCAVYTAIAKLKSELKVDVFHVVKNLRKCHKGIVSDEVEYLFCLEMLEAYIESSQILVNAKQSG